MESSTCTFLELLPRAALFDTLHSDPNGISSSFCASRAVDDRELESADVPIDGFLVPANLSLHFDFPFSGGVLIRGAVLDELRAVLSVGDIMGDRSAPE